MQTEKNILSEANHSSILSLYVRGGPIDLVRKSGVGEDVQELLCFQRSCFCSENEQCFFDMQKQTFFSTSQKSIFFIDIPGNICF